MFQKPRYFSAKELVDPSTYEARGERSFELLDDRLLVTLDALRKRYGSIIVNNWEHGGPLRNCGFRSARSSVGAPYSQHRYGRAADLHFQSTTEREVYEDILATEPALLPGVHITAIENIEKTTEAVSGKGWLHIDCRWHSRGGIWIVNP